MHQIKIDTSEHKFDKKNLLGIRNRRGVYDKLECSCGVWGRSYQLGVIEISGSFSAKRANNCPNYQNTTKKIKIIIVRASGEQFDNLTPDSVHEVVTPPKGYKNDASGVWVMGVKEPVKVLTNEFTELT